MDDLKTVAEQLMMAAPLTNVEQYIAEQGGIPDMDDIKVPAGITIMEEPIAPIPYTITCDSTHESVLKGVFTEVNGEIKLDFYLPEGWSIVEINHKLLRKYIDEGLTEFGISNRVAKIDYNPLAQRTCKWFTAGREQKKEYGTQDSSEYEFDKPHGFGVCSNKKVKVYYAKDNPACPRDQLMATCEHYEPEPIVNERQWTRADGIGTDVTIRLLKTRRGPGIPEQHIEVTHGDQVASGIVDRPLEEIIQDAITHYGIEKILEIAPESTVVDKEQYFDYVLSS